MSNPELEPSIEDSILECLSAGEKRSSEIKKAVSGKPSTIDSTLSRLAESGEIIRVGRGRYRLPDAPAVVENPRKESENIETINSLLTIYDIVLANIAATLESELSAKVTIEEKIDLIKSLRWLGATVDQLMKRWYLVHRGYDANTRQAQEDAKKKTADLEKTALEASPPESQVVVVAEYHERVRGIWDTLPEAEKKSRTL